MIIRTRLRVDSKILGIMSLASASVLISTHDFPELINVFFRTNELFECCSELVHTNFVPLPVIYLDFLAIFPITVVFAPH